MKIKNENIKIYLLTVMCYNKSIVLKFFKRFLWLLFGDDTSIHKFFLLYRASSNTYSTMLGKLLCLG